MAKIRFKKALGQEGSQGAGFLTHMGTCTQVTDGKPWLEVNQNGTMSR